MGADVSRIVGLEVGMLGEGVYEYVRPETLRVIHFFMGVGGTDRFLSGIPVERWGEANRLAVTHVQQFCKCEGDGCMACRLVNSVGKVQADEVKQDG